MKLFYHLYGYLLLGMLALIGIDEYLGFQAEIKQYETDMINNATQNGKSISGMISHAWKENGETKALELIRDASEAGAIKIRWVWPDVLLDESSLDVEGKRKILEVTQGMTVSFTQLDNNGALFRYTYVPVDIGDVRMGALELRQALSSFTDYSNRMVARALTITILLAVVCGLILYIFVDRKIRLPLTKLMAQAKRIGRGDLSVDHSIGGNDELAEMARTMNDMCSRLLIAKEKIKFEYNARLKTLEQLRYTERLSSFGVLSAEIAHELGTPLNVVDGRAKMIINENLQPREIEDCATIIKNQAERMAVIIRQLLDYTRRPGQHISTENIALLIKQVLQLLHPVASKKHITFSLVREEGAKVILSADFSQLQQVLVNLLMNSIQAMPNGGKVDITLANEMVSTSSDDGRVRRCNYIKLQVQDEGEGICKEHLDRIFTPFFTTKTIGTGTGLGLSIAHGIVEEHGGWIDVESKVHQGACFTVHLPAEEQMK
ncbi:MAG: ATP-binding protein [Desulforhopalus sp.]